MGVEMASFMGALGLFSPVTLVPLFVSKLTESPLAIGAVTAANQLGWLPQLLAVGVIEQSRRKWPWVLVISALERLPILALALIPLFLDQIGAPMAIAGVLLCMFGLTLGGGLATMPWMDVLSKVVPASLRGRFFGAATTVGQAVGALAALFTAPLLDELPFPQGFVACFGVGFAVLAVGYLLLLFVVEPAGPEPLAPRPFSEQMASLAAVFRVDRPFAMYVGGLCLSVLGTMGAGFLAVYAAERHAAPDELVGWFTAAYLVSQLIANPLLGWFADHRGYSSLATLSTSIWVAGSLAALFAPGAVWMIVPFVMLGAAHSGQMLARMAGAVHFAPVDRRPSYIALANGLAGLAGTAAPLAGGIIAGWLGYEWLFGLSALISLASSFVLMRIGQIEMTSAPERSGS